MIEVIETHTRHEDYVRSYEIEIKKDGKKITGMHASDALSHCPEDATLSRDLSCVFNAIEFFQAGITAAREGHEVVFRTKYLDDDENEITQEKYDE